MLGTFEKRLEDQYGGHEAVEEYVTVRKMAVKSFVTRSTGFGF